jgi:hypothetical protein
MAKRGVKSFICLVGSFLFLYSACKKSDEKQITSLHAKLLPPVQGVYHSCYPDFSDDEDSVNTPAILDFEALANKQVAWVYFSNNWWNGITFPKKEVDIIHALGKIPHIRMMARSNDVGHADDPIFTLQRLIDGEFDAALNKWAIDARETRIPLNLEFGIEVNGNWFPWNGSWNGGGSSAAYGNAYEPDGPERFKDAYKHIITIFRKNQVTNATWFFHVNYDNVPDMSWNAMKNYYPGDDYIDWIAISVYGIQEPNSTDDWRTFEEILDDAYAEFTAISPNKPLAVNEFGVCEAPALGNKADWISNALQTVKSGNYPRIKAISYWNEVWQNSDESISDLRINSSAAALNAYKTNIADTFFVSTPVFGY